MRVLWPLGIALRGVVSSRPVLRWLKTVVVSDRGQGAVEVSGGDQEGVALKALVPGVLAWASTVEAS
jgi:hypothetical protein